MPVTTPTASKFIKRISGLGPQLNVVSWSPDSTKVAVGSAFHSSRILDIRSGRTVTNLSVSVGNHGLSLSPDGKMLAVAALQPAEKFQVWNVNDSRRIISTDVGTGVTEVAWSPDGNKLAVVTGGHIKDKNFAVDGGGIYLYDPLTWAPTLTISYTNFVGPVSWAPDSGKLVFASTTGNLEETQLVVWDIRSNKNSTLGSPLVGGGGDVQWSPDGKLIAVPSDGNKVVVIDVVSGTIVRTLAHGSRIVALSWSSDSQRLASAGSAGIVGEAGAINVWEVSSGALLTNLDHDYFLTSAAWSPDGNYLASTDTSDSLWLWDGR